MLYMEGHVETSDFTNIPGEALRNYLLMPLMSPEINDKIKKEQVSKGSLALIDNIVFPLSCLFPMFLIYLGVISSYLLKMEAYKFLWFLIMLAIPFYYIEVRKHVVQFYERQMRNLNIPYDTEAQQALRELNDSAKEELSKHKHGPNFDHKKFERKYSLPEKVFYLVLYFMCSLYPPWIERKLEILRLMHQIQEKARDTADAKREADEEIEKVEKA
jgi:hypothetical protein